MRELAALKRVAAWCNVLTFWQLGVAGEDDPACQAVRDHRELSLLLRVEVSALFALLVEKGICSVAEMEDALETQADRLAADLERRFPGCSTTREGVVQLDHGRPPAMVVEWHAAARRWREREQGGGG